MEGTRWDYSNIKEKNVCCSQGCLEMLEKWTQDQALILLTVGLAVIFVEVGALLSTFFACSRGNRRAKSQASTFTSTQTLSPFSESDHDFGEGILFLFSSLTRQLSIKNPFE